MSTQNNIKYSFLTSLIPFFVTLCLLLSFSYLYGKDIAEGYSQLALLVGGLVAIGIGLYRKRSGWVIWKSIVANMKPVWRMLFFLMLIGATSVAWCLGGIIPTMVYYGLKCFSPKTFLVTTALFSGLMALACGSSWLTIGTMGVAFLGIGKILGLPLPLVAGAIISGAYFGDKVTPLSETTTLAASMTQTPMLRHVRYMLLTSVPCFLLTLFIFGVLGLFYGGDGHQTGSDTGVMQLLEQRFYLSPLLLLLPLLVMGFTMLGYAPALLLSINIVFSLLIGGIYQTSFWGEVLGTTSFNWTEHWYGLVRRLFFGMEVADANTIMARLLCSNGVWGMLPTIAIVLSSLFLGGAMEGTGLLHTLVQGMNKTCSYRMLVVSTTLVALFFNIALADQYLAIIMTSKIFVPLFTLHGLASENLSRAVEDTATVTSPLVPWNTCGVMQAEVLGVATLVYLPYCFFNLLSPLFSIGYYLIGIKIAKASDQKTV
ncbi:MAG: Na+/H+ antiporter NhaC family protein [Cytophagales bacterium]